MVDKQRIEKAIKEILEAIGEDPTREGLKETPKRVANMYEEIFAGIKLTNKEIAEKYNKCFEEPNISNEIVVISDIDAFSYCEHHMALMYNMTIDVGYIPNNKIIGLSKVARICDIVTKRLQLQERIGNDIYEILKEILNTEDIIITIKAEHSCLTTRGIKKNGSITKTTVCGGVFRNNLNLKKEFYTLSNKRKH